MRNSGASAVAVSLNGLQHGKIAREMCYVHDYAPLLGKQAAIILRESIMNFDYQVLGGLYVGM